MLNALGNVGITKNHVTGFVVGVGAAATTYYIYMKNKEKVDDFLLGYGIDIPSKKDEDLSNLNLEELMLKKETIEDLIAEMETELEELAEVTE